MTSELTENLDALSSDEKLDMLCDNVVSLRTDMDRLLVMLQQFLSLVEQLGNHPMFAAFKRTTT